MRMTASAREFAPVTASGDNLRRSWAARYDCAMTNDLSRQDATSPDNEYSLSVEDAAALYKQADLRRTPRTIQRYCENGHLVSRRIETPFGNEKYFITPASVATHIAYLKEVRRVPTGRDTSRQDATDVAPQSSDDESRHEEPTSPDLSRPVATQAIEEKQDDEERQYHAIERDPSRRVATDLDIFEHPYVKRLEAEVEKWQGKFEDQVQRTQEVLVSSNQNLMELQRTTAVANSQTLADFILKAGRFLKSPFTTEEGDRGAIEGEQA
jgi:hypothetical protein